MSEVAEAGESYRGEDTVKLTKAQKPNGRRDQLDQLDQLNPRDQLVQSSLTTSDLKPEPQSSTAYRGVSSKFMFRVLSALIAIVSLSACAPGMQSVQSTDLVTDEAGAFIIGGQDSNGQEDFAKHIVALYDLRGGSICTASILSESILLTAAHCVASPASDLRVVFGTDVDSRSIIVKPVDAYQVSPLWSLRQFQQFNTGDIALVKFSGGLPAGFKAIKFLSDASGLKDGQNVMLAGYGTSDGVRGSGAGKLRYVVTQIKKVGFSKTEILMEQSKGKGACHGDSGGPAYIQVNGELIVIGVTSRGVDDVKNDCSVSSAYSSVPYYANWIRRTSEALNNPVPPSRPARAPAIARR